MTQITDERLAQFIDKLQNDQMMGPALGSDADDIAAALRELQILRQREYICACGLRVDPPRAGEPPF
jgi:hypothetical protein